ncbi:hypothetical protein AVEN_31796-1 [Araneus ventricosus]|uniref:Uncharacterized protein n=1 Tax=Araneus ventricosus TaxID=182803 RepID=A0A4Y2SA61_ARAVE|nr:hypothetical protein AVEN_194017-1 [Araneus ventricosus]GBN84150.1 hypothetical protein AVEN_238971-1 [Araneus ventricosus]GBO04618.1 hypothetical protein AVEN_25159-1 [Araneus ventricosus]GBO04632.1 hypothetical protein AVEN_31796-1 [Araneus ventricosus]
MEPLRELLAEIETEEVPDFGNEDNGPDDVPDFGNEDNGPDDVPDFGNEDNGPEDVLEETFLGHESFCEHDTCDVFPSREHSSQEKESLIPLISAADLRTAAPGGH